MQARPIGKQNECGDKKVYAEIASRARLLAATVPEEFWAEICSGPWLTDDEDYERGQEEYE